MARWKLPLLLLVALTFCTASTDDVHLFVRGNVIEGVSSLCRNETANVAVFVSCKIRTARRQGEECSLFYMHRRGFEGSCEPRFTLQTRNQTLFLHLAGLTPQDSGKYTCECSNSAGTHNLSLNVVVEEEAAAEKGSGAFTRVQFVFLIILSTFFVFVIVTAFFLTLTGRIKRHRDTPESAAARLYVPETPLDIYQSLEHPESDLYQSISNSARTVKLNKPDADSQEFDMSVIIRKNTSK